MTPENHSENEELKSEQNLPTGENTENKTPDAEAETPVEKPHQADMDTEVAAKIPEEKVLSEIDRNPEEKLTDEVEPEQEEPSQDSVEDATIKPHQADMDTEIAAKIPEEKVLSEIDREKASDLTQDNSEKTENIQKQPEPIRDPAEEAKNLEERQNIIEKLKNLYTNTDPGTNLFKAIREVKEMWSNAGKVAKSEFKILNNNYFHHLNQFYAMLDMNKEYLEQEYSHNLEKRQHIIERAKELENEPLVQKALNELQYLHKLWKEEAEPVAEEFREKTWEEFREISNRIHGRKAELSAEMEEQQNKNLDTKNSIITQIKAFVAPENKLSHSQWQNAVKKVEELRDEFLNTGSVPRKLSNQNWNDFKAALREFNSGKNDFYKSLKEGQGSNLEKKQQLIKTAQDNMNSEDWETAVPLFKKLQDEWKNVGHVPRSQANRVWEEFREACNTFFDNYRTKNNATSDNWKENYKNKKALLDQLKEISDEEGSAEKIDKLKADWNAIGKVPKDKIGINTEFNKVLREKLKLNKMNEFDLTDKNLSELQLTDKARKMKNQVADLESEIATLENNLGFFSNPSRENPLLKDTYTKIDDKKAQLESLKHSLHQVISGE